MTDNATQEERLSRDYQQNQNDSGLNDGLTDERGNNVGVGIPTSGNDFGATHDTLNKISPQAGNNDSVATGDSQRFYDDTARPITDGGRPDEDYQDDDISSEIGTGSETASATGATKTAS